MRTMDLQSLALVILLSASIVLADNANSTIVNMLTEPLFIKYSELSTCSINEPTFKKQCFSKSDSISSCCYFKYRHITTCLSLGKVYNGGYKDDSLGYEFTCNVNIIKSSLFLILFIFINIIL